MGKLDEIKGAALNDDALDEVSGGSSVQTGLPIENYIEMHDYWINDYKTKKCKPWTTETYLSEVLDTIRQIEIILNNMGEAVIPFDPNEV